MGNVPRIAFRLPLTRADCRPAAPRRPAARRAVRAGAVAFALLTVGLNVALDTAKPEWRDPEFGHRLHALRRLVAAAPGRPVVVALGTSRTQMGLSPPRLDPGNGAGAPLVYNFGQAGAGPPHQLLTLRRLLAAGVKPDAVLVEVLPAGLTVAGPVEAVFRDHAVRLGAADLRRLAPYGDDPAALYRRWAGCRLAPWHSLRLVLMSHARPGWLPWPNRVDFQWRDMHPLGWLPYPFAAVAPAERTRATAVARGEYQPALAAFRVGPLGDRPLRDLLALCRRENIRAAAYLMPESATVRGWYPPDTRRAVAAYLAGLTREFAVPVFDASDWLPDDAVYADGHHLLRTGAAAFSERFGRECLGPWLANP